MYRMQIKEFQEIPQHKYRPKVNFSFSRSTHPTIYVEKYLSNCKLDSLKQENIISNVHYILDYLIEFEKINVYYTLVFINLCDEGYRTVENDFYPRCIFSKSILY